MGLPTTTYKPLMQRHRSQESLERSLGTIKTLLRVRSFGNVTVVNVGGHPWSYDSSPNLRFPRNSAFLQVFPLHLRSHIRNAAPNPLPLYDVSPGRVHLW